MQIFGGALLISFKPVVVHRRQPTVENDESDPVAINSAEQTGYEFNSNNFDDEAPYSDEEPMSQTTTEDNHDSDSDLPMSQQPIEVQKEWRNVEMQGLRMQENPEDNTDIEFTLAPQAEDIPEFIPADINDHDRYPQMKGYTRVGPNQCQSQLPCDPFIVAFGLWLTQAGVSHAMYQSLQEVLSIASHDDIKNLPKDLKTLQTRLHKQLPLSPLHAKYVDLNPAKVKSGKDIRQRLFFLDPCTIIENILNSEPLRCSMYFGMAQFVDKPKELWHSEMWAESIRACSGDFGRYKDNGKAIFPSDIIRFRCSKPTCMHIHRGRIQMAGRDLRQSEGAPNTIVYVVHELLRSDNLPLSLRRIVLHQQKKASPKEYFLIEEPKVYVELANVIGREDSIVLHQLEPRPDPDKDDNDANTPMFVDRVLNGKTSTIRSFCLTHPPRAELEIQSYGREYLESHFANPNLPAPLAVPLFLFIDGFGLLRSVYRTCTGMYVVPCNLPLEHRMRTANVFTITLGVHGISHEDLIAIIGPGFAALEKGVKMNIRISSTTANTLSTERQSVLVSGFIMGFTGDMVQHHESAGFLRHNAAYGCRVCHIPTKQMGNLNFDIVTHGRYHHQVNLIRENAGGMSTSAGRTYLRKFSMGLDVPAVQKHMCPSVDLCRMFVADPAHSEWQGLFRNAVNVLSESIIAPAAITGIVQAFNSCPLPAGWNRIQNPIRHRNSWSLQEQGRACTILPLILSKWLRIKHMHKHIASSVKTVFPDDSTDGLSPVDIIVSIFASFAASTKHIITPERTGIYILRQVIIDGRIRFQKLTEIARLAIQRRRNEAALKKSGKRLGKLHAAREKPPILSNISSQQHGDECDSDFTEDIVRPGDEESDEQEEPALTGTRVINTTKRNLTERDLQVMGSRPNVHIGLHLPSFAQWFGTNWNANVLVLERKHKTFKQGVIKTNLHEPERQLLLDENLMMTLRLLLGGAYDYDHAWISITVKNLLKVCPKLFQLLLPPTERVDATSLSHIPIHDGSVKKIRPLASHWIPSLYIQRYTELPSKPDEDPSFAAGLRQAYSRDYSIRNVYEFGNCRLQYCLKFSFVSW